MFKSAFLTIFLVSYFGLNAQVETTTHQGNLYFVYPHAENEAFYSLAFDEYPNFVRKSTKNDQNQLVETISPNPDKYESYSIRDFSKQKRIYLLKAPFIYYRSELEKERENNLAPVVASIPDGNYIQYFKRTPYVDRDTLKYNYHTVAAIFTIKNNLPDGEITWFSPGGDTIKHGFFDAGIRVGTWTFAQYATILPPKAKIKDVVANKYSILKEKRIVNYQNGLKNGSFQIIENITTSSEANYTRITTHTYSNDQKNGAYTLTKNGALFEKGMYQDDVKSGEWFFYFPKNKTQFNKDLILELNAATPMQLIKHYTLADSLQTRKSTIIRGCFYQYKNESREYKNNNVYKSRTYLGYVDNTNFSQGNYYRIPNGFKTAVKTDRNTENAYFDGTELDFYYQVDVKEDSEIVSKRYTRQEVIDSFGYQMLYEGLVEEYYPNGQLRLKFEIKDGVLQEEDTVFWENGLICSVVNYLPDRKGYEEKMYHYTGALSVHRLYDGNGRLIQIKQDSENVSVQNVKKEGNLYNEEREYFSFEHRFKKPITTETILFEKLFKADLSPHHQQILDPIERKYNNRMLFAAGQASRETTVYFDSAYVNYTGTYSETFGPLSREFKISGKINPPLKEKNGHFAQQNCFKINAERFTNNDPNGIWKVNGIPYTGKIILELESDTSFAVYQTGTVLEIHVNGTALDDPEFKYLLEEASVHEYDFTSKRKKKFLLHVESIECAMVQGKLNGKAIFRIGNGKMIYKTQFSDGKIYGVSYSRALPRNIRKSHRSFNMIDEGIKVKRYICSIDSLKNGIKHGTSIQFDYKGDTVKLEQYNMGVQTGRSIQSDFFNSDKTYEHFTNDTLNGTWFVLDSERDTISKGCYNMGIPVGELSQITDDEQAKMSFKNGKLNGALLVYNREFDKNTGLKIRAQVKDNYAQGVAEQFYDNQVQKIKTIYQKGVITDYLEWYDPSGILREKITLKDSFVSSIEIWHDGILNRRYDLDLKDSLLYRLAYHDQFDNWRNFGSGFGDLKFKPVFEYSDDDFVHLEKSKLYLTRFYPDGSKKSEGAILKGKKVGLWKHFLPNGNPNYQIDYRDSSFILPDSSSFTSSGIFSHYDANGALIAKSLIIDGQRKFNCSSDEDLEIPTFYTFWEKDEFRQKRNGLVENRYEDGTLQSTGEMKNGLPEGIWKYYDPFGKLNQIGIYVSGKREGRWLMGDLSDIAYIGDLCLNPNLFDLEAQLKKQQNTLKINLVYYESGIKIRQEHFIVDKN